MYSRRLPRSARRPLAWMLACALLFAQALGLAHRVLHADAPAHAHPESLRSAEDDSSHGVASGPSALFDHHEGAPDCRLFDQLASGDALPCVPQLAAFDAPPSRAMGLPSWPAQAAITTAFQARGPPAHA